MGIASFQAGRNHLGDGMRPREPLESGRKDHCDPTPAQQLQRPTRGRWLPTKRPTALRRQGRGASWGLTRKPSEIRVSTQPADCPYRRHELAATPRRSAQWPHCSARRDGGHPPRRPFLLHAGAQVDGAAPSTCNTSAPDHRAIKPIRYAAIAELRILHAPGQRLRLASCASGGEPLRTSRPHRRSGLRGAPPARCRRQGGPLSALPAAGPFRQFDFRADLFIARGWAARQSAEPVHQPQTRPTA